jgi:hypothetical protein
MIDLVLELEEGETFAVTDIVKAVHVRALSAKQVGFFTPCGDQRKSDDVLVKPAHGLHIRSHVGVVMKPAPDYVFCAHVNDYLRLDSVVRIV